MRLAGAPPGLLVLAEGSDTAIALTVEGVRDLLAAPEAWRALLGVIADTCGIPGQTPEAAAAAAAAAIERYCDERARNLCQVLALLAAPE